MGTESTDRRSTVVSDPATVSQRGAALKPLLLPPNPIRRFYSGGARIAALRRTTLGGEDHPEEWLGSTTCVHGSDGIGLSVLPDGRRLIDAIAADPEGFLGRRHVAQHGAQAGVLVKLLEAGERLPVHCHPDRAFARRHLGSPYGKTEAWMVIGTEDEGTQIHLGFSRSVDMQQLRRWVDDQDVEALLAAMNVVTLRAGDTCLVPAGLPHAIGRGALIVELQEPTDLSVLLEWRGYPIDGSVAGHLGLGFATALEAVDRSGWPDESLRWLRRHRGRSERALPSGADQFFRSDWLDVDGSVVFDAEFSLVVVTQGSGRLSATMGDIAVEAGDVALVPYGSGPCRLEGQLEAIRCRPALTGP